MEEEQITALAREYAEEIAQEAGVKFDPQDLACSHCEIEANAVIEFLLRRYYLVEKEAVRKEYSIIQKELSARSKSADDYLAWDYANGMLESLFPDLGKEVEG